MGNKITKMTPLNKTKYYLLGILMMVASVISVFAFTTHYTSPENSAVHTIAAASIEDWTQVYNYEVDSSTSTVTITGLKDDYAALDGLVIPSYIGGNPVKTIGNNAFASKSAKTVYFASNSQVTTIKEGAFSMYSLQYIQLPESLTTIWYNAFRNCSALKYLNIPKNLQYFGSTSDAAYGYLIHSKNLQYIDCDAANPYFTVVDNVLYTKDMKTLVLAPRSLTGEFTIPEGVERISNAAMIGMNNLTKINFPSTLKTIGNLFLADTSSVEEVILPDSVTRIDGYFLANNGGVKLVKLSNSISRIEDYSIYGCANLTSIVIPEGVTHIGAGCFTSMPSLSAVVLPTTIQSISANTFKNTNITHMQKPYDTFTAPADTFTNKNADTEIVWHDSDNMFDYTTFNRGNDILAQINGYTEEGKNVTGVRIPAMLGGYAVGRISTNWNSTGSRVVALAFTPSSTRLDIDYFSSEGSQVWYFPNNINHTSGMWGILGFARSSSKYLFVANDNPYMYSTPDGKFILSKDNVAGGGKRLIQAAHVWDTDTINLPDEVAIVDHYSMNLTDHKIKTINGLEHTTWVTGADTTGFAISGWEVEDLTIPFNYTYPDGSTTTAPTNLKTNYIGSSNALQTLRYEEGFETLTRAGARNCGNIKNVVLPKSLKLIKANAFKDNLPNLTTTILIPSGCTVEEGAFPSGVTLIYEDQINWENVYTYKTVENSEYGSQTPNGTIAITGLKSEYQGLRSVTIPSTIGGTNVTCVANLNYSTLCEINFASGSHITNFAGSAISDTNIIELTLPASYRGQYGLEISHPNLENNVLQNINVDPANTSLHSIDGVLYYSTGGTGAYLAKFPSGRTGEYTIPNSVTTLCNGAFGGSHLSTLYVPNNVTTMHQSVFNGSYIANIIFDENCNIPRTNTNNYYSYYADSNYARDGVAVPPNGITIISTCEYASTAFESIEIPATVTTIGTEAFRNNTHLKYLLFQGNTAVTIGSRAFVGCTSLPATVVVPDGSTWQSDSFPSNVTNVVFVSDLWKLSGSGQITPDLDKINTYTGLNTLIVPKTFNGTTITTYYGNGISLPNIGALVFVKDTEVTTIAQSSLPYSALKYMYLPDSLTTTTQFDVWSRAEGYTYPLTTLKLPNNLVLPVTTKLLDRGYAWNTGRSSRIVDMPNISEFVLSDDNPRYKLIDGNLYTLDGTTLVATVKNDTGIFTLPAGVTTIGTHAFYQSSFSHINLNNGSLTTIWDGAFAYCNNLISIALPSTITNLSNADSLFLGCAKLEHIEMPNNIALGGAKYMFSYTNTLKGFRYPDSSTASGTNSFYAAKIPFVLFNDGMTTISGATFHGTGLIETVTIPASVTSIVGSAFATSNVTLKNIYLNPNNTSFVIQNGILYSSNMKNLIRTSINAPENIVVPEGVEYIYQEAFDGHASTSITLPSTLRNLSSYAFTGSNFTEIVIPEGVTTIGGTVFNSIAATSVTLPSSVTIIKNGAFSSSNNLVNVTLSEGTTTIESKAFNGLRNLETVNLPSTITSIAGDAFYNCPKLQISTIPAVMTRIEDGAFKGNTAITSITIPNTVVYVGAEAFMNCTNLETVIFEAGSPLTTLGASVFSGCTKLKTITLPQSLVAIPQSCFDGDIKLTGVTMPTTVRDIEAYAFQGTSSLGAFTFHEGLQRILGQAFTNSGISGTIVLPSTLNTLSNPYNFQGCTKLTKVIFNNNILTTIETNTFKDCSNLAEVVLPTSITSIKAYAFANTPKLKTINLPTGAYSLGNYAFYNTGLETLYVHRNANIASEYAFAESKSLKTIEFVSDWRGRWSDSYGGTYFVDYTFQNCTALESVILPSTLVHTGMGMFQGCTKLSSVTGYDPEKLTYIENSTFSGCSSLEYFNLAYARTINSAAFQNCTSLTNIVSLNSFVSHGVRVFAGCTNLRMNITIPATAASAFTDKGTEMFNGSGITGLTFSEGITTIPANFAQNCANLTTVVLPSTITKIGSYAFYNCTNLSNINNLPDGLETIDSYAFYNCKEAFTQSITIPSSVVTIKNYAFYNCTPRLFDLSNASSLRYIYDYAFALSSTSNTPAYEQTLLLPDETNSSLELIRLPFRYQKITNEINLVFNSSAPTVYQPFRYAQYVPSVKIKNIAENANTNISGYFAFYSTRLKNVYFDASVRSIEPASTFAYSDSISTIYIDGAIGTAGRTGVVSFPWTSNTFNSSVNKSNINVFVAAADVDAYKADSYWSAFNILSHTATVSVSFHSLFGTAPAAQSVQVVSGRATNPGDLTCPEGYTFKGYYTYSDSVGYTRITDFSALVFYADTTIYCLWDIGNDIVNYLTFSTTTFNGVSGYAITGYTTNLKYFPDLVIPRQYNGKDILTINNNVFTYLYWLNSVDFVSNSNVMYFN
ncbi:MAG: leucine-rich repeat protein [Clostridia bacterium]|nr:leucine-rich repeat protein [Clostridia bacterium]